MEWEAEMKKEKRGMGIKVRTMPCEGKADLKDRTRLARERDNGRSKVRRAVTWTERTELGKDIEKNATSAERHIKRGWGGRGDE